MRKATIVSLLIVAALLIASCQRQLPADQVTPVQPSMEQNQQVEPEADTAEYVDSQFVDPEEKVEIGEMV